MKKKILITILLVLTLIFQVGCTDKKNEKSPKDIMLEFNSLVEADTDLQLIIKYIDENIKFVSNENASIMIEELEKAQKNNLSKLEDKFNNINDKDLEKLEEEIKDKGYKIETAEGSFFPVIDYEFYEDYSSFVTPDIKDYISIMAIESNEAPAKDAALVISWDEIINRTLKQEEFIKLYPDSSKTGDIQDIYNKYVYFAFYGLNNTPLFNYDTNVIEEEAKSTYFEAIDNNKESQFINKLKDFMDILKENDYKLTEAVDKYRDYLKITL